MLSALFVALFQVVAGEPAVVEPRGAPEAESTAAAPSSTPAPPSETQTAQNNTPPDEVRRCRTETATASRVRRSTICRTQAEDEATAREARAIMRENANHTGPNPNGN